MSPAQIMEFREETIAALERANSQMWRSGVCDEWLAGADDDARVVLGHTNGQLLGHLLQAADVACGGSLPRCFAA